VLREFLYVRLLYIVLRAFGRVMMTMMTMMCVKFHPRIAN